MQNQNVDEMNKYESSDLNVYCILGKKEEGNQLESEINNKVIK